MGCGLPKLKRSEDNSPGKIYSTLKRPQVQTKIGVAYTYRFLDFLLGTEEAPTSRVLCLSSVRELPAQLQDLYQQGFVLAAVHPFVHPCGPDSIQQLLHRAILIRLSDSNSSEKSQLQYEAHRLETDLCLSSDHFPDTELVQGYIKKGTLPLHPIIPHVWSLPESGVVQDVSELGGFFVGFLHQPGGEPCVPGPGDPEEFSLSLHSSPMSLQRDWSDQEQGQSLDHQCSPEEQSCGKVMKTHTLGQCAVQEVETCGNTNAPGNNLDGEAQQDKDKQDHPEDVKGTIVLSTCNNNQAKSPSEGVEQLRPTEQQNRMVLFALFNHMEASLSLQRYYTVKVPLQVQLRDGAVSGISANWLDYMTHHFSNGASLIDAYFHLGNDRDIHARLVESVFVFQEGDSAKPTAYDAIVVEQWTTISNVEVKTDYVPLLHSLAVYGWRLTCVLATPIIKSNSDGSLATKQVVFLQRPVLARKKESKKLSLRARSKSNKNSVKDTLKSKNKRSSFSPVAEKETEEQKRIQKEELETEKEEREKVMRKYNRQNERLSIGKDIREEEGKGRVWAEMVDEGEEDPESETEVGTEEEKKGKTEEVEVVTLKLDQSMQERQEGGVIHEVHKQGGPSTECPVDESSGARIGENERGGANVEGPTNESCMGRIYKSVCELNSSKESQPLQRPPSPSC